LFLRNVFGKREKTREEENQGGRAAICLTKVRVRLTLIKIKCMIAEIIINMLGISFESFGELGLLMILIV